MPFRASGAQKWLRAMPTFGQPVCPQDQLNASAAEKA